MTACVDCIDICVVRGDTFPLDVALTDSWPEVIENPTSYQGRMVLREYQDDDLTNYVDVSVVPEVLSNPSPDEPPVYLRFKLDISQTQSLPEWEHVGFVELIEAGTASDPLGVVKRLFNLEVEVHD